MQYKRKSNTESKSWINLINLTEVNITDTQLETNMSIVVKEKSNKEKGNLHITLQIHKCALHFGIKLCSEILTKYVRQSPQISLILLSEFKRIN